jgi:Recombination endonuclease VII
MGVPQKREKCIRGHDRTAPDALTKRGECRECITARNKAKWADSSYREQDKQRQLQRRYGIDLEFYEYLLAKQHGRCAICNASTTLCVDHDHLTGRVRGLLCTHCNTGLGKFADDTDRLKAAVRYLEQ